MNRRERWILTIGLTIGMLVTLMIAGTGLVSLGGGARAQDATATAEPSTTATGTTPFTSAVDVVKQVSPAVVTVVNEQRVGLQNGSSSLQPVGSGTGFIIDTDGHIVTNWHVVDGGTKFQVVFADGTTKDAKLIGSDEISDLAVVQVSGKMPGTVPLGDSDAIEVGEPVLAIGSPLGNFQNTVTEGIVSATNRDFPDGAQSQSQYNNLIQHDAAINPGNSGGPLVNFKGEVIGVNTLGISVDQQGQPIQGLFFAIPSNSVKQVTDELIKNGSVTYPYFGIRYQSNSAAAAAQFNLSTDQGVIVVDAPQGGPAADAGIESGDVITKVGDYALDAQTTFSEALFHYKPGDTIEVTVKRGDKDMTVKVTLGDRSKALSQ
jgi:2-alkenal reductase